MVLGETLSYYLFFLVFLSQIFVISYYYPKKIRDRSKKVLSDYPQEEYPKLYPVPVNKTKSQMRNIFVLNLLSIIVGLFLLAWFIIKALDGTWQDARIIPILTIFLLIQYLPIFVLGRSGFHQLKLMRILSKTRKAELQPRGLFDYISPAFLAAAICTYIAFCALVIYIKQFGFVWFGGYMNIFIITLVNIFFAAIIYKFIYGKKINPLQAHKDRFRETKLVVKILVLTSIMSTLFAALTIIIKSLGVNNNQSALGSILFCVFCQVIAVFSMKGVNIPLDEIDFSVYRSDGIHPTS